MRLALLALAALVWIAVPVSARAEGETVDTWDGTAVAFTKGNGTEDDPWRIENAEQLAYLAQQVNNGTNYEKKHFRLVSDLDLRGKEWTPIGTYSKPFWGGFDGDGHTITGMTITGDRDFVGLFGACHNFTVPSSYIKNVTVKWANISGHSFVGAIAGEGANISDCYSIENTIYATRCVGGVCGSLTGSISGCYNSSSVKGNYAAGGIMGTASYNGRTTVGVVQYCYNIGAVTVSQQDGFVGGIISASANRYNISNCLNCGKITGNGKNVGGIVGSTDSGYMNFIGNCYYNSDLNNAGVGEGANDKVIPLTTSQLCGALPSGLDPKIWKEGSVDTSTAVPTQGRFGTAAGTYINLQSVETAGITNTASVPVYNYVTTNGDDWATYTLITTAEEFAAIGKDWDETKWSANYVLVNDIDVSGVELKSIGNPGTAYTGKFSGDGHTISHVDMTKEEGTDSSGLFAQIDNSSGKSGKVMLLAANGDIVTSYFATGGICGNLSAGEIYGCSFTGTVKGSMVGGISGAAGQHTMISQCFFEGDVQGSHAAAGICGMSGAVVGSINHCISIATIDTAENDAYLAGITNSGDSDATNCYFNNDICNVKDEYNLGRTTLQLTSSSFFEVLKTNGFNTELWTKKANDKENGIAYYPSLGENNAVGVNYTTGLQFERADDAMPIYGQDITFKVKALVNFATDGQPISATDGQPISAEDTDGSFEIRIGIPRW